MAEVETKQAGVAEVSSEPPPLTAPPLPPTPPATPVVAEEKVADTAPHKNKIKEMDDESKAPVKVEKAADLPPVEKTGSVNRDAVLTRVATEKKASLIKAWEESEKTKAENKAVKKLSAITSWENTKKANIEADLKKYAETLEKKKAVYAEKLRNKIALLHKEAEEKKAMVEAKRGEDLLKSEEMAAKYRATGSAPKKKFGLF